MPLYQCFTAEGLLSDEQRAAVARRLTDIHTSLTGAPKTFVHIVFRDGQPSWSKTRYSIHGSIRAGRSAEITNALTSKMIAVIAEAVQANVDDVSMKTVETPALWVMEGGRTMSEPGAETEWLAFDHREKTP